MTTFPAPAGSRLTTALVNHTYSISDVNVTTVTAASYTDLSSIYQVPANDAALGISYELLAHGNGETGSTSQTLQLGIYFGSSILGIAPTIGTTAWSTSLAFRWWARLEITPNGSSSTTGWQGSLAACLTYSGGNVVPGGSSNFTIPLAGGTSSTATVDATAAQDFSLRCQWGSATGSPTITCVKTRYTRLG